MAADKVPSSAGSCEALAGAIEGGLKALSFISANGMGDNSAARESNRQLEKVVETNLMQMNLGLLQANRCPAPKGPLVDNVYYLDALKCSNALMRGRNENDKNNPPECDRSKWKRMGSDT
jgi:hypothetical protein